MTDRAKLQTSIVLLVISIALLAAAVYGMLQTPRPGWTRVPPFVAFALIIIASRLRRNVKHSAPSDPRAP